MDALLCLEGDFMDCWAEKNRIRMKQPQSLENPSNLVTCLFCGSDLLKPKRTCIMYSSFYMTSASFASPSSSHLSHHSPCTPKRLRLGPALPFLPKALTASFQRKLRSNELIIAKEVTSSEEILTCFEGRKGPPLLVCKPLKRLERCF